MAGAAADTSGLEEQVLHALSSAGEAGVTKSNLEASFGKEGMTKVIGILNQLLAESRLNVVDVGNDLIFRLIAEQVASKLLGLQPEAMMVYQEIERAGNQGIWNRDIKNNTNIQQNLLSKALKELERRSLIKSVKSIHQKTKKIWMLYDLTPSTDITGGPWYTDNEFDHEFVNEIAKLVDQLIRTTWQERSEPTSLQAVDQHVKSSGVSQEALSTDHIREILQRLVFDCKIETVALTPDQQRQFKDKGPYYRSVRKIHDYDHFTALPCGVCPVFTHCTPGGLISPETCQYFDPWLEDDQDDVLGRPTGASATVPVTTMAASAEARSGSGKTAGGAVDASAAAATLMDTR